MSLVTVGNDVFPKNLTMFKKWSEKKRKSIEWLYSVTGTIKVEKEVSEF